MAEEAQARVRLQVGEAVLELEGPVSFVAAQLERSGWLAPPQRDTAGRPAPVPALAPAPEAAAIVAHFGIEPQHLARVLALDGGPARVVATGIAGTEAQRTREYCLLYCLAHAYLGRPATPSQELRDLCQEHGCLDGANFARALRSPLFHSSRSGAGVAELGLSASGAAEARRLLVRLTGARLQAAEAAALPAP